MDEKSRRNAIRVLLAVATVEPLLDGTCTSGGGQGGQTWIFRRGFVWGVWTVPPTQRLVLHKPKG
jgi:hypothetical protein